MAVNSYVEPVYTADLDLVVVAADLAPVLADLQAADWRIKEYPYSINAQRRAGPTERTDSMLLVQFSKPVVMQPFVDRALLRPIFGLDVPVAALPDLVSAKLAAWSEPKRRTNKRRKDELDLLRLAEAFPPSGTNCCPSICARKRKMTARKSKPIKKAMAGATNTYQDHRSSPARLAELGLLVPRPENSEAPISGKCVKTLAKKWVSWMVKRYLTSCKTDISVLHTCTVEQKHLVEQFFRGFFGGIFGPVSAV